MKHNSQSMMKLKKNQLKKIELIELNHQILSWVMSFKLRKKLKLNGK